MSPIASRPLLTSNEARRKPIPEVTVLSADEARTLTSHFGISFLGCNFTSDTLDSTSGISSFGCLYYRQNGQSYQIVVIVKTPAQADLATLGFVNRLLSVPNLSRRGEQQLHMIHNMLNVVGSNGSA